MDLLTPNDDPVPALLPPLPDGSVAPANESPTDPPPSSPPPDPTPSEQPQSPPPILPPPSPPLPSSPPPSPPPVQSSPPPQNPLPMPSPPPVLPTPSPPLPPVTSQPPPSQTPPTKSSPAPRLPTPSPPPNPPAINVPPQPPRTLPSSPSFLPRLPPPSPDMSSSPTPPNMLPMQPFPPNNGTPTPPVSMQRAPPMAGTMRSSASDVNVPLVVGLTAGLSLFLIVVATVFLCCARKGKKKPQRYGGTSYYKNASLPGGTRAPNGGDYYPAGGPPAWPTGPSADHVLKVAPPPGWQRAPFASPLPASGSDTYSSHPTTPPSPTNRPPQLGFNKSTFSYEELAAATGGFSQQNLLGQGGFGYVHKGVLAGGKEVAVKSLKDGSGQGEREFQAEVEIISRVHHRHLVSLVGYCISDGERMLVYEFMPNNTLEFHLHGKDRPTMSFATRLKIALGSAKGLAYLHEDCHPKIIHRDIKAANILLDFKFEAMVADFGLAKLSMDNNTHVSTRIMGTFGYLAPEYASSGKLTEKSDVFSFGVMLLELITGRRPVDAANKKMEGSLVEWARPLLMDALATEEFKELVDPNLEDNYDHNEMMSMVACAAACVRHSARRRPKMSQIVRALEGESSLEDLMDGVKPGQSTYLDSFAAPNDYEQGSYSAQMRRFQKLAFASTDFASSEYGQTSEYGLSVSTSSSEAGDSKEIRTGTNKQNCGL